MINVYKGGAIMLKLIEIPESIKNIYLVDTEIAIQKLFHPKIIYIFTF